MNDLIFKNVFYQLAYKILDTYLGLYLDKIQNVSYHFQIYYKSLSENVSAFVYVCINQNKEKKCRVNSNLLLKLHNGQLHSFFIRTN